MAEADLAAEALADIVSIAEAAFLAEHKWRNARTVELFGRATERAVAAGVPPDSLVLASLRLRKAAALEGLSSEETGIPAASAVSMRTESRAITLEVMRALSARDQAGTLLPGALPADELAYAEAVALVELRVVAPELLQNATFGDQLKSDAPVLGYELMMRCCSVAFASLMPITDRPPLAGAEAEAAHAFVMRALALVAEVRRDSRYVLGAEAQLIKCLTFAIAPERRATVRGAMLPSQFYDALVAAWDAPALQAALRSRGTLQFIQRGSFDEIESLAAAKARQAADVAAVGLRACALPACGAREVSVHQFKRCGGCKAVAYCSAECAKAHWKAGHKRECSRAAMPAQPKNE